MMCIHIYIYYVCMMDRDNESASWNDKLDLEV